MMHEKLGMNPAGGEYNPFAITSQYQDGLNLYEYVNGNPITQLDSSGLKCAPGTTMKITLIWKSYQLEVFPSRAISIAAKALSLATSVGAKFCSYAIQAVALPTDAFPTTRGLISIGARMCWDEHRTILDYECVDCKWDIKIRWPKDQHKCKKLYNDLVPNLQDTGNRVRMEALAKEAERSVRRCPYEKKVEREPPKCDDKEKSEKKCCGSCAG